MDNFEERIKPILIHALGISKHNPQGYRNYFASSPGAFEHELLTEAVSQGLMRGPNVSRDTYGDMEFFYVTEKGRSFLVSEGEKHESN